MTSENNNNNINKRTICEISPEKIEYNQKLRRVELTSIDSMAFNWDVMVQKMDALLDRKLEKLATKEDITGINTAITSLQNENTVLKQNVSSLQNTVLDQQKRMELLEKKSKRNCVVMSGLVGGSYDQIKAEVDDIFKNVLKIEVLSFFCTKLNKEGTRCCIELSSPNESQLVLRNSKNLGGTGKFVRKDLTASEDKKGYHIRNLRRACMTKQNLECRITGACLNINGKRFFSEEDGTITANDEESAGFLRSILEEVGATFNVCCPKVMQSSQPQK